MKQPLSSRSAVIALTSAVLVVTLGAWMATAGSAHAEDPPDPGSVPIINSEPEEILVIANRPPRQPAKNAVVVDGLELGLESLVLNVDLSQGVCPPGCDLTAWAVSQALSSELALRLNLDNAFQSEGIKLDNLELGLPDDLMFANWVAEDGSNIALSEFPRTVDTTPTATSNYSVTARPDGSGTANYYARAVVAGETSVSGNFNVFMDGRGAAGSTNAMSVTSFIYLGENAAGVTVNGAVNLFGGDKTSLQAGKSAIQVGMTGKDASGHEVGVSASMAADGTAKVSVGALITPPGLPPLWVRGDFGVDKGASISAPNAGVSVNATGNTNGFGFGLDLKLDILWDFFTKKTGSK